MYINIYTGTMNDAVFVQLIVVACPLLRLYEFLCN
jgi:hypothetical protein